VVGTITVNTLAWLAGVVLPAEDLLDAGQDRRLHLGVGGDHTRRSRDRDRIVDRVAVQVLVARRVVVRDAVVGWAVGVQQVRQDLLRQLCGAGAEITRADHDLTRLVATHVVVVDLELRAELLVADRELPDLQAGLGAFADPLLEGGRVRQEVVGLDLLVAGEHHREVRNPRRGGDFLQALVERPDDRARSQGLEHSDHVCVLCCGVCCCWCRDSGESLDQALAALLSSLRFQPA
jgi:hypothetical protein